MKILYLTTVLPSERKTGGEIASQCFIDALKQDGHKVLVVGYQRQGDVLLNSLADEMSVGQRHIETGKSKFRACFWMILSFITRLPYSSAKYYSPAYKNAIAKLLAQYNYDIVILDHAQLGWLLPFIDKKLPIIFMAHNIEQELYREQSEKTISKFWQYIYKRESRLIQEMEETLAKRSESVWTFTTHDGNYFSTINPDTRVFHLPSSAIELESPTTLRKNCDIGIIGSWTWKANMLGLKWFFQTVYPHLPKHLSIQVAGKGAEWLEGRYCNVKYCGFVPDAQEFMSQAKVIAIPSVSGGGVQIKTLNAIASGSAIVATPVAMRGISDYPASIKVAENPKDFATYLIQMLSLSHKHTSCDHKMTDFQQINLLWSHKRRENFLADVKYAVKNFSRNMGCGV
ncbi:MAG: glycosyltransferase [Scytonema sp. PMC 1069.18]|nr:glycosyltransferase [Scytonema sp. PMC 1069.18]MEC4884319.1 glycosyltransferase [Scytonema sp. PMC 1070.18]